MALSRTARILIALLLLSAAAFFWVNFFSRAPEPVQAVTSPAPAATPTVADAQGAPPAATTSPASNADSASTDGEATPTVVVPSGPEVATRDLVVSDLPFMVTEPPAPAAAAEQASAAGATRPSAAQRISVNPFSPILVRAPAAASPQAAAPAPSPTPQVVQVQTPSEPAAVAGSAGTAVATREVVRAPAPRPMAPPSTQTAALPRQLPSGTLPATPDILRTARTQPRENAPTGLGRLAAVREPGPAPTGTFATAGGATPAEQSGVPAPLGPAKPAAPSDEQTVAAVGTTGAPLAAGTDELSRYLRDNNIRFTGTVLGPVSVGVFRSKLFTTPVVLSLGQALPDTHIVLTDLRGHEARFSMDDFSHTLSLDLRR